MRAKIGFRADLKLFILLNEDESEILDIELAWLNLLFPVRDFELPAPANGRSHCASSLDTSALGSALDICSPRPCELMGSCA
mmetsp:Transcript_2603/g.7273  ORF Transcript_2603/g.7273 Transcript_2603/m.7273 type:complete len:82 (-) Transcript_2603:47-292(-)